MAGLGFVVVDGGSGREAGAAVVDVAGSDLAPARGVRGPSYSSSSSSGSSTSISNVGTEVSVVPDALDRWAEPGRGN